MMVPVRTKAFAGVLSAIAAFATPSLAQFTAGNVVVLQVGDGTASLSNIGNAVFLKEFSPNTPAQTAPTFTVAVPTTGAGSRLVIGGSATTEGQMTLSPDSLKLVFAGYDTSTTNTTSVSGATAANIARVIDTVGVLGIPGRAAMTSTAFSGSNIRAATKGTGEDFWAIGGNTGVQYMGTASAAATVFSATSNLRFILAQNSKLYFSTASGLSRIGRINSQPTSGPVTADTMIVLGTGTTPSPYGLAVNAAETIVYVADDRTNGAGGIQKWVLTSGTWSIVDTFVVGASNIGARGLAVNWSGTYPTIFATTTDNKLVRLIDSSFAAGFVNTPVVLATAPTGTAFRGVALSPKACTVPTATITAVGPTTICAGTSVTLNANTGAGYTYQWYNGPTLLTNTTATLQANASGSYTVRVTGPGGCFATSPATTVTVNAAPNATFTTSLPAQNDTAFICPGSSVTLTSGPGIGTLTYQWRLGAANVGTGTSYVANPPGTTGNYSLVVTNTSTGCSDTSAILTVARDSVPAAVSWSGPTTFCAGDSVVLNVPASPMTTYQWQLNGLAIPGATTAVYPAKLTGSYSALLVRTNPSGTCTVTSVAISVTAKPLPQPVLQYSGGVLSTGSGYSSYVWILNGTPIPGATSFNYTPTADGSYTVRVDSAGCTGTSAAVNVTGLGVEGIDETAVRLFPNPTESRLQIAPAAVYTVVVKDTQGRVRLTVAKAAELDLTSLADGLYFATMLDADGFVRGTARLVKASK